MRESARENLARFKLDALNQNLRAVEKNSAPAVKPTCERHGRFEYGSFLDEKKSKTAPLGGSLTTSFKTNPVSK